MQRIRALNLKRSLCRDIEKKRGLSIAELLVSMALFGLVMSGVAYLIRETIRYYNVNLVGIEIQQQALMAMNAVRNDFVEASASSFRTEVSGFVFGLPRDQENKLIYKEDTGDLLWHQLVCYYTIKRNGVWTLERSKLYLGSPSEGPPELTFEDSIASFQINEAASPRVIARHVEALTCTLTNPTRVSLKANYGQGAFVLKLQTEINLGS